MPWLICSAGDDKGLSVELSDKPLIVGRDERCGIRLVQQCVSRRHCQVCVQHGRLLVEDLNSFNGIKFGGKRIKGKTIKLNLNEYFEIGNDRFDFASTHDQYIEASEEVSKDLRDTTRTKALKRYSREAAQTVAGKLDERRRFAWWSRLFGRKEE